MGWGAERGGREEMNKGLSGFYTEKVAQAVQEVRLKLCCSHVNRIF